MWKFQSKTLFFHRSGEEIWKERAVWNSPRCYISVEPVNHAAHVRGPLYSCHCSQRQMQLHTLAGVKCCQAHLWPSVKGHDLRVCHSYLTRSVSLNFCQGKKSAAARTTLKMLIYPATSPRLWHISFSSSSSSSVTSGLQMWFTRNVFPVTSLPVKAYYGSVGFEWKPEQTCFAFVRL